jgi:hypothetical protein
MIMVVGGGDGDLGESLPTKTKNMKRTMKRKKCNASRNQHLRAKSSRDKATLPSKEGREKEQSLASEKHKGEIELRLCHKLLIFLYRRKHARADTR